MLPATNNQQQQNRQQVIPTSPRFLSIQSHVVSGYCGNKSATFPLQLLEFEMDIVNSVQLSNHTQYKVARGQIYGAKEFEEIHAGLKENDLLKLYDAILSGYVADIGYIESMASLIKNVKQARSAVGRPECFYALDPVLGDDATSYYVPNGPKVAQAYKEQLMLLADMITPNRFEASILSGVEIDQESPHVMKQALAAIEALHVHFGVRVVAITSLQLAIARDQLICIVSHKHDGASSVWTIQVPRLDCPFTGTGDLFTALLTGWLQKTDMNIKESLENTANTIHDILEDTLAWFHQVDDNSVQSHELRLVQNRDKIIYPSKRFKATLMERVSE